MLDIHGLNYWALLVAWVVNVVIGAFWYSPVGFGKAWSKITKIDMMKMPKSQANTALTFVVLSALVQTVALGLILHSLHATRLHYGWEIGLVLWFGFTAVTTIGTNLYTRFGWKFQFINSGFFLVVTVINSAILTKWR